MPERKGSLITHDAPDLAELLASGELEGMTDASNKKSSKHQAHPVLQETPEAQT